jgi:hypothetical protein
MQPYKTHTPLGKKDTLGKGAKGTKAVGMPVKSKKEAKKSKMLPRVAPKGKYKVGKFSNGVGVGP